MQQIIAATLLPRGAHTMCQGGRTAASLWGKRGIFLCHNSCFEVLTAARVAHVGETSCSTGTYDSVSALLIIETRCCVGRVTLAGRARLRLRLRLSRAPWVACMHVGGTDVSIALLMLQYAIHLGF